MWLPPYLLMGQKVLATTSELKEWVFFKKVYQIKTKLYIV